MYVCMYVFIYQILCTKEFTKKLNKLKNVYFIDDS